MDVERSGRDLLRQLLAEKGIERFALFLVQDEGKELPGGVEAVSGFVLARGGQVYGFWLGWDEGSGRYVLEPWYRVDDTTVFADDPEYRRARELLGWETSSGDLPPRVVQPPHRRHRAASVTQRTLARRINSVIESWVDVDADIAAIKQGEAFQRGDSYSVYGRVYRLEATGRAFPVSGPGVHQLSRGAFKALGVYNTLGVSARAEAILDRMGIASVERMAARRLWQAEHGQEGHDVGGA